jgi:hypothetical protein
MSFELKIHFTGLCAFVFDTPVKLKPPDDRPQKALIVMPNILKGMMTTGPGGTPDFRQPHYPRLVYHQSAAHANAPFDLKNANGDALLFLQDEQLEILPDGKQQTTSPGLTFDRGKPVHPRHPAPEETKSLWWLVEMTDAFPLASGRMQPEHLEYPPSSTGTIITNLTISQGTLRTAQLSEFGCTFLPPASQEFNRKIAASLELTMRADRFVKFHLPTSGRTLHLEPPHKHPLEVQISNMELEDFIPVPTRLPSERTRTIDFGIYFALAGLSSEAQLMRSGFQSIVHGLCPPGGFVA